jgi:queuosine precursor transporter
MARYKYLDSLVLVFVVVLLVSNLVAQKVCRLGPLTISGAELLFPITYIFGDVFTEVYGYQASRRAIWIGFFASALLSAAGAMAVALPADPGWHNQQAFETVFGLIPRFVAASLIASWPASNSLRVDAGSGPAPSDPPSSARPSTLSW